MLNNTTKAVLLNWWMVLLSTTEERPQALELIIFGRRDGNISYVAGINFNSIDTPQF